MNTELTKLNEASNDQAIDWLKACCAAPRWAAAMAQARPFASAATLRQTARELWAQADAADLLAAFAAHPLIGDVEVLRERMHSAGDRAHAEQGQVLAADSAVLEGLADLNKRYHARHGFTFIVYAKDKSAAQMLALLEERLPRTTEQEIATAAAEQMKITELRMSDRLGITNQ